MLLTGLLKFLMICYFSLLLCELLKTLKFSYLAQLIDANSKLKVCGLPISCVLSATST